MSNPIKPPGGEPGTAAGLEIDRPADGVSGTGEFAEAVASAVGDAKSVDDVGATGATTALGRGDLAAALHAGELSVAAAVESTVERALAGARGLSAAHRKELETQLRVALAEDPTLLALQKDLSRVPTT